MGFGRSLRLGSTHICFPITSKGLLGVLFDNVWKTKLQMQHVSRNLTRGMFVPLCLVELSECSAQSVVNAAARSHYLPAGSIQHHSGARGNAQNSLTLHKLEGHRCLFPVFFVFNVNVLSCWIFSVKMATGSDFEFPGFCVVNREQRQEEKPVCLCQIAPRPAARPCC